MQQQHASAHPSRFWAELSARDFEAARASGLAARTVAVLPVAAIEQHGPHLPLAVDALLLQGVIDAALAQLPAGLPVLFLPPQQIGLSTEHLSYPGTLTLSPATLLVLWTELGEAVARAGVRRLLLLNGHGGNVAPMDIAARELRQRCGLLVYSASWFSLPLPPQVQGLFSPEEHRFGIHGGEIETSMALHLAPQLVRMEHARRWRSSSQDRAERHAILGNGRSAKMGWAMEDYHPAGAVGDAAAATADKGRAVVQAAGQALAQLLAELQALDWPLPAAAAR
ncbi:creatininase family protein [Melaminivora sp.]|uniref:creatininase family protein n=1 Tax=Melaminivora sp. TaxID=1933032 RepID=UPI0028A64499|nr:creatininase family protein [Melaminivora sp.]